ncbi:MAG: tRNA (cytidine(34)-2'-O)-methyltransferase [Planctomycetota bacterium]|jgi:tRNA (cytidine/uridine-2'-O-)-methyltransferase
MDAVVLVEPEIAWNTGNAGRSCLAFGAHLHLVGPLGFSLEEKRVRRAGLDYWKHVSPTVHPDWDAFERTLDSFGTTIFLSADAPRALDEVAFGPDEPCAFVFGRESTGFAPELRERFLDRMVRLPLADARVRSLNVSTCVGIVLYEAWRRRAEAT